MTTPTKMTIFYKKRNLDIDKISTGEQDLSTYARMDLEDAELVYGFIVVDYDDYAFNNIKNFDLVNTDSNMILQMKQQYKEQLQKYI